MALTTPRGPLGGPERAGWFSAEVDDDLAYVEPHPRRIVARRNGEVVIDTEMALMVHRPNRWLQYAFPVDAVGSLPSRPEPLAPGFVRVPWDAVDEWVEEGRLLRSPYPPNPYHRVDCHPTTRRLTVTVGRPDRADRADGADGADRADGADGDLVLVDTDDTIIVFETTLNPVLYVARHHVRMELLRPSVTTSWCNYKGEASYWTLVDGETVIDDIAWSYDSPLAESAALAGHLSFYEDRATVTTELPSGWTAGRPSP